MAARLLSIRALPFQLSIRKVSMNNIRSIIGKREIVGFGFNGQPVYVDRTDFPFPAIRWKEPTAEIQALREKEKGDWRKLTFEEKRALYRASFCQTFAEMKVPPQDWKVVLGGLLMLFSISLWLFYFQKTFVYEPVPGTFAEEIREAQMRRIIDLQVNPIEGLTSKWDYEKDDWKE